MIERADTLMSLRETVSSALNVAASFASLAAARACSPLALTIVARPRRTVSNRSLTPRSMRFFEEGRGDVDVFAPRLLRRFHRLLEVALLAQRGELNQHW